MGVELLIEPGRSGFLGSDAQEIGPGIARRRAILSFIAAVADAIFEWPSPSHLRIIFSPAPKKQERDAF